MNLQDEIFKSQEEQKLHVLNGTGHQVNDEAVFIKSCVEDNLIKSENKEDFLKGFGSDLEKRFPKGKWVTMSGSRVFINGGKVVAGLDGFNKEIDKFFDKKKAKQQSSSGDGKRGEVQQNIDVGLEYTSGRGEKMKVVGTKTIGGDNYFEVVNTTKEKPLKDLMTKEDIQSELDFAKKNLPQLKEREKLDKEQEIKEALKQKEYDDIDGFGINLSSMALGKVKQDLNKKVITKKGEMTRKEYIKDKLKEGYSVKTNAVGEKVLMAKDGSWIGNKNLVNKTALSYAEHLQKPSKDEDKPVNESVEKVEDRLGLGKTKNMNDVVLNIDKILEQYPNRSFASNEVEKYLAQNIELGKRYLAQKGIKSKEQLSKYLKGIHTKARKNVVSEQKQARKNIDEAKTKQNVSNIINQGLEAEAKMQKQIKDREIK